MLVSRNFQLLVQFEELSSIQTIYSAEKPMELIPRKQLVTVSSKKTGFFWQKLIRKVNQIKLLLSATSKQRHRYAFLLCVGRIC